MDVKVSFKAGGSFVELPPQFSLTSENIYLSSHDSISSFNTRTGKICTTYKGLSGRIIGFSVHEYQSHECVTACSDLGEVITWKTVTHFKIITKKIPKTNLHTFHIISHAGDLKALYSCKPYKTAKNYEFAAFDLNTANSQTVPRLKLDLESPFYVSSNNDFFAVAQLNDIYLVKFADLNVRRLNIAHPRVITCISCHNTEEVMLTGDNSGRVVLHQNIFKKKNASQAVFHWHTLPVRSVAFSTEGSYFYSGGEECVMVRWQAQDHLDKKFLPRLPSHIKHLQVSPSNCFVAIATEDNGITVVDTKFDRVCLIQNLVIGNQFQSGILCCPRTKALVMNGNVGQIQFYSPQDNSLLYNVDVVGHNKISNERSCQIENTQVTKIALNLCGSWTATVEERTDVEFSPEIRLKFWHFDSKAQNFVLNTNVEYPHENSVNSLAFQPTRLDRLKCVSVGDDKKFKVWYLTDTSTIYRKGDAWQLLYAGFHRDLPCKNVTFTSDSSLMAIAFDQIITAWVPETCELKCSLVHPVHKQKVDHLKFSTGMYCHLLVAAGDRHIVAWNILTLAAVWVVPLQVSLLIEDPVTIHMAAITADAKIYIFTPDSPELVYSSDELLQNHKIDAAVFVPTKYSNDGRLKWNQRSQIFFIDNCQELYAIGTDEETECPLIPVESTLNSAFSMTIPKSQVKLSESRQDSVLKTSGLNKESPYLAKFLDSTTETMPAISDTCHLILKEMVQINT